MGTGYTAQLKVVANGWATQRIMPLAKAFDLGGDVSRALREFEMDWLHIQQSWSELQIYADRDADIPELMVRLFMLTSTILAQLHKMTPCWPGAKEC
jgi:hypothetical protein